MNTKTQKSWLLEDTSKATALALVLIVFYSAPIYLGLIALVSSDGMQEQTWAVSWFAAFLVTSDSTFNEFHKVLLPIISAVSAAAYAKRPSPGMYILIGVVFLSFFLSLVTTVWFDIESVKVGMKGLEAKLTPEVAKGALGSMRETLLMYFMMLTGLVVANRNG